tara:strand:+ start:866 stop:1021 length:156 start_codon:yes stop_codon:yes gene_type:complete
MSLADKCIDQAAGNLMMDAMRGVYEMAAPSILVGVILMRSPSSSICRAATG